MRAVVNSNAVASQTNQIQVFLYFRFVPFQYLLFGVIFQVAKTKLAWFSGEAWCQYSFMNNNTGLGFN